MITFVSYNQALMWSRFGRLFATMAVVVIIYIVESMTPKPTWLATWIGLWVGQLIALKCWADMIVMAEPYKNCWAFKED